MTKIMVSVGEISGDRNLAEVLMRLKKLDSSFDFCGLAGPSLIKQGVRSWVDITTLSTMGFLEPLKYAFRYFSLYRLIKNKMREEKPDLVLCVDSQGLNSVILGMAKDLGIPTLYYISPMEWHWGTEKGGRKVLANVDRILSIIQKEDRFYKKLGGDVVYVGHPLVDSTYPRTTKEEFCERYNLQENDRILALFPGSRKQEINLVFPVILEAARFVQRKHPDLKIFISVVEDSYQNAIREQIERFHLQKQVVLYTGHSCDLIAYSSLSLVTSGTISLEHAILGKPCVVAYKLSKISYWAVKKFFPQIFTRVPYVSLANEFFQEEIFPECLQEHATPEEVAYHALRFLNNPLLYEKVQNKLKDLHKFLGEKGTLERTACEIIRFSQQKNKANNSRRVLNHS